MSEEVSTVVRGDGFEKPGDGSLDLLEAARVRLAQQRLELGERLFDRVQVGTIGRQMEQLGAHRTECAAYRWVLMATQIVHHHDVACPQGRNQELLQPGEETLSVDRAVQDARRGDALTSQSGHEGECLARAVWHFANQTLTFGAAAMQAGHVGLRPGLVDEDQAASTDLALPLLPLAPSPDNVSAILLTGAQAFF